MLFSNGHGRAPGRCRRTWSSLEAPCRVVAREASRPLQLAAAAAVVALAALALGATGLTRSACGSRLLGPAYPGPAGQAHEEHRPEAEIQLVPAHDRDALLPSGEVQPLHVPPAAARRRAQPRARRRRDPVRAQGPEGDRRKIKAWYLKDTNGLLVAPLPALGSKIALTAWNAEPYQGSVPDPGHGYVGTCSRFDATAFTAFVKAHRYKSGERFRSSVTARQQ